MLKTTHLATFGEWVIDFSMPIAACYHLVCSNVFLNTAAEDAQGLEKYGDIALAPFQYVFAGHTAAVTNGKLPYKYELKQRFDYNDYYAIKMTGALCALPLSTVVGCALKGISFFLSDSSSRHRAIEASLSDPRIRSNNPYYRSIGIDLGEGLPPEKIQSQGYARRPGEEGVLQDEKAAFKEVIAILKKHQIPFWVDFGTCLGTYRYGGCIPWDNDIDVGVLEPDFLNIKHALNDLDDSKYLVEDWSNRILPETYIRIYIRSTGRFIDLYHYAVHPERRTVNYIASNASSIFLPETWKAESLAVAKEMPYENIFPLKVADYDGIEVPVPNQIVKYLQHEYGTNLNPTKVFNEETGQYEADLSHPYCQHTQFSTDSR